MKYSIKNVYIPDRPDIIKVMMIPSRRVLINKAAARDAKIIWLLVRPDDVFPAPIYF